ncbi:MAG: winged helix-turn-helix transcriptional regulator [Pseudomonadota bacterium]
MDNAQFVKLCSKAWSIQVLAALDGRRGGRIAPIAAEIGAGRSSVTATFQHLLELELLVRNPGHGHPLRPEFVLTRRGMACANWASRVGNVTSEGEWKILRKQWSLPVLRLFDRPRRYRDLRDLLRPVTDRALSLALKEMVARDWVVRRVEDAHSPPQVSYGPARYALRLQPALASSFAL